MTKHRQHQLYSCVWSWRGCDKLLTGMCLASGQDVISWNEVVISAGGMTSQWLSPRNLACVCVWVEGVRKVSLITPALDLPASQQRC